ncbi:(uracil-5)-methyltransferase [Methyloceanibacter methanicus]|uniref:(Uracil-5)-methyltransferase n=1 Tax=Methyloceanibacter methanicus TaxID=1774968 RepID=A0A1E3W4F8_9HYPH|nr:class I SAM-dependent RNA methyltransferase [Methyloceanibacter methanicus]ODS00698.1 (uracil-5)-methyltransferase [Methyloceanibacter methanicus]
MSVELTIDRLGAQGDGVAETPDGSLFVPFTLPGERVRAELDRDGKHANCVAIFDPSPERVAPVCRHFGACGGCSLQHLKVPSYLAWKRDLVGQALAARGSDVPVEPVRPVPLANRRRATFSLERRGKEAVFGYRRARSHELIGIEECPILSPAIAASLPALKELLTPLLSGRREARVAVTETETGLDVVMEGARPPETALAKLAAAAGAQGIARLTAGDDSVTLAPPTLRFGRAQVRFPPGAFLQAAPAAEAEMVRLVREGVGKAKRVADLFCGLGTFSFALAERATVDAYETDADALTALEDAARHATRLKPMRTHRRDLFRDPLGWQELKPFDAVVFDPPRAGAAAQAEQLARSKVDRLVAVSCNPGTLARDVRILVDGGYAITRVTPVDQFLFSSHVEVVAHLTR